MNAGGGTRRRRGGSRTKESVPARGLPAGTPRGTVSHFLDRHSDKKKKCGCKHFFFLFFLRLCAAFLPLPRGADLPAGTRRRLLLSPQKTRPRGKTLRGRVFSARVFQDAAAGGFPLPPLCGRAPELPGRGPRPRRERRLPPRNSRPALPSRFSFRAPSP